MGTLVFDGDCGFCTRCAEWARKHLSEHHHEVVSWQSILDLHNYDLTMEEVTCAAWWIDEHGAKFGGERAIARTLHESGRPWKFFGSIIDARIVRPISHRVYRIVANNRQMLPGGSHACRIDKM